MRILIALAATAALTMGCEDPPAPLPPPDPPYSGDDVAGVYAGSATSFPGYERTVGAAGPDRPTVPGSETPATIELRGVHQGAGAPVATLDLRIGDEHLVTEVIIFAEGEARHIQATRAVRCGAVETAGRTTGAVAGPELTLEEIALEQPCTVATVTSQLWRFRGRRRP